MIGIHTNLLVRYLAQDDPTQSKKASSVIERAIHGEAGVFVNHIVLCEVMWVLDRAYGFPRATLGDVVEKILQGKQFEIEDKPTAWQALNDFKSSRADYADCLIGAKNRKAGCTTTLTLDRATSALSTFSPYELPSSVLLGVKSTCIPTGGEPSSGYGLAVAKERTTLMHGELWCESDLGKGARFFVRLPQPDEAHDTSAGPQKEPAR